MSRIGDALAALFPGRKPSAKEASEPSVKEVNETALIRAYDEAFRLGRLDRATLGNNPPARSGDSALFESGDLMHRRMRAAFNNNALMKKATAVLRDLVVGNGINAFSDPVDYTFGWSLDERAEKLLEKSLTYALESDEKFLYWAECEAGVDGKSWWDMQPMAINENILVGGVIQLECMDKRPGRSSPLCYQLIEKDQIDYSQDRPAAPGQREIINGFEIDQYGREVAVYLYDAHPFSNYGSTFESKRVPADRYQHIFKPDRPSQTSAATWLHACGQSAIDRDTYFETELRAAVKAALVTILYKTEHPNAGMLGLETPELADVRDRPQIALGTSPLAYKIGVKEDVEVKEAVRPNTTCDKFFNLIDHDIAGAAGLSYYSLTGRFNETNYGGFRGAINLEDAQIRPIQNWLGRKMILPVRRRFNELAMAMGEITTITASEFIKERRRYQRFDVIGPGRNLLEPAAENEATLGMLRGGLTTLKIECARRGLHWILVLRQICLENRVSDWLKIVLDHSKGQGGQAEGNTRSGKKSDGSNTEERAWSGR